MVYSVVINLGYGNLFEGFPVITVGLRSANNPRPQQFIGSLAPAPYLVELYRKWRMIYETLQGRLGFVAPTRSIEDDELEIEEGDIVNVSVVDFYDLCQQLELGINNWLDSPGVINISRQLRAALNPADEIRVIIETQDITIQKLPWHCCNFFEDYPRAELSFARIEYKSTSYLQSPQVSKNQVRILAILGNSQGIDLEQEQKFLESLPDAEVEFVVKPTRQEFNDRLWDSQGWDMLFFAGHSQTEQETGIIYINENLTNNSLTIEQLTEALKAAIEKGLKIVIFNSCNGLGLAQGLEKLNLPTTIVMREPVPNRVAEEFFNYFLQAFAFAQESLYISVQQARRRLQGLEDNFPGASWLPVIFINPAEEPPTWASLKEKCSAIQIKNKRQDWGDAIDVSAFYGRNDEINTLKQWVVNDNSRLVTIIGMGGIGKTALSVKLVESVENEFDCLIWRSLRNAPSVEELLTDLIGFLTKEDKIVIANSLDKRISQFINCLRELRCLVVLDNFESVLDGDKQAGYGQILRCVGDTLHRSCVLVTSREKPKGLNAKVGENLPVRVLSLKGLSYTEGESILKQKGLSSSVTEIHNLVESYGGNPLALKIAANTIIELFAGNISDFLQAGTILCNDIFDLLDRQFERLSMLERQLMYWLAINREWVSIKNLQSDIIDIVKPRDLITALESLQSRCLIENQGGKFTQQPVLMEYVTEDFIEKVTQEIYLGQIDILNKYAFLQVQNQDYTRNAQILFILQPIADKLLDFWLTKANVQIYLNQILAHLKSFKLPQPGYAAGNIINLLRQLNIELNNYDFSHLNICQANLEGINLQQTNFANCNFEKSVFTQTLGSILGAKFNPTGKLFATAIENQIYLWEVDNIQQLFQLNGHSAWIQSLVFHPNGKILASGSNDNTIRLWNTETRQCLQILRGHTSSVQTLAFNPKGNLLASGSNDKTIRLWDVSTGDCLQIISGHTDNLTFVAFHPEEQILITASTDKTVRLWNIVTGCTQIFNIAINWRLAIALSHSGKILVTGSDNNTVKFWDISNGECIQTLPNYHSLVWSVTFSHDDKIIITGSEDNTIKIWNVETLECLQTLCEHQQRIWLVDLHPNNSTLLSISEDQTIKLWDITSQRCLKTLKGYSNWILSLAFSPDSQTLVSSSQDQKIRFWDMKTQKCTLTVEGHDNLISTLTFAPAHIRLLASGSDDSTIKLWNYEGECQQTLRGHTAWVYAVAFSPQGEILASGSRDNTVKIWDSNTGACLHTFVGHENRVKSVTFNNSGTTLVSASDDKTIKFWDVNNGTCLQTLTGHEDSVCCVVYSSNADIIASGSCNKIIKLWDVSTGECIQTISAHSSRIRSLAFSPDGKILVSCSDDCTIKLWDVNTGENIRTITGHDKAVWTIAISTDNCLLASGSEDQTIKLWNLQGECIQTLRCMRQYEGMNINNTTGLTDAHKNILISLGAIEQTK
ncbi:hypothetical protein NIES2101_30365 [Calothrix sp. HK-06]|nr:hypothetical protein NIES2101_30365 [Calothrix sp. HK-06]